MQLLPVGPGGYRETPHSTVHSPFYPPRVSGRVNFFQRGATSGRSGSPGGVPARPGPRAPVETGKPFSWNVDGAGPLLVPPVTG
jgi:hypothetical protein